MKATTIEKTGKSYKAVQVLGVMLTLGGCMVALGNPRDATIGLVMFFAGLAFSITAKVGAWWEHG